VWNLSAALFNTEIDQSINDDSGNLKYLLWYLRSLVVPSNQGLKEEMKQYKTIDALDNIEGLRLNKAEESRKQAYFDLLFPTIRPQFIRSTQTSGPHVSKKGRVLTSYLRSKINDVLQEMEENIF
jgi:hypothetical protein